MFAYSNFLLMKQIVFFFSCVKHVKRVHHKTNEEYNDFIVMYKKDRISRLFLKQKADIQSNSE